MADALTQAIADLDRLQQDKMKAARLAGAFPPLEAAIRSLNDVQAGTDRAALKDAVERTPRISDYPVR